MKKLIPCLAAAMFLSACSLSIGNGQPITTVYDFGPQAVTRVSTADWNNFRLEVQAVSRLNSRRINYRLLYVDALAVLDYSGSRWADNPAVLLNQSLSRQLNIFENPLAVCTLSVEIQEFSHVFGSAQDSNGLLKVAADLSDSKRSRLARNEFLVEVPAESADAPGGVHALAAASNQLGEKLSNWLDVLAKENRLGACNTSKK